MFVRAEEVNHNAGIESRVFPEGYRLPASYANLFIANEAVFLPTFDVPEDQQALRVLAGVFPGRKIIPIPSRDIILGGGMPRNVLHVRGLFLSPTVRILLTAVRTHSMPT